MEKKNTKIWAASLLTIAVVTVVWAACRIAGIELPDFAVRLMGLLEIAAIPVLVYTSIRKKK